MSHYRYVHPDFGYSIPVGRHPSKEIGKPFLDKMPCETGLKKAFRKRGKKKLHASIGLAVMASRL